jgi:hypothetical protein
LYIACTISKNKLKKKQKVKTNYNQQFIKTYLYSYQQFIKNKLYVFL